MTDAKNTTSANTASEEINIPFEDEKGMYGTSPAQKKLTDEDVEHLTSKTIPRVRLSQSKRKVTLYISLFMIAWFLLQLIYYRTIPITGFSINPVFGLNEMGLVVVCTLLTIANWFLITPDDQNIRYFVRSVGTGIPAVFLIALYTLPAQIIYNLTKFLFT